MKQTGGNGSMKEQAQPVQQTQPVQQAQKMQQAQPVQQETFNRPPRIWTASPQGKVVVPAPPKRENLPTRPPIITFIMPIIMVGAMLGIYILLGNSSPQQMVFLLPMLLFSVMTPLSTLLTARQQTRRIKQQWRKNDRKFREVLKALKVELKEKSDQQRQVALLKDPDNTELETCVKERTHLWERRPDDPDFLEVRVGKGTQPFAIEIQLPEMDIADPMLPVVQKFQKEFALVKEIPNAVSLTKVKSLGITGPRQVVADFARGLLCQIATLHSPEDVRIVGLFPTSQQQDWDWLKEMPHTQPLKQSKQRHVERLFASGQDEADELLNFLLEELTQRATKDSEGQAAQSPTTSTGQPEMPLPHIVVIVHDYIEARKHPALSNAFKLGEQLGVSIIYMVAQEAAIPGECRGVVRLLDAEHLTYASIGFAGETLQDVRPDIMEVAMARRIAHALAPLHVVMEGEDNIDLPTNARLLDLLGIPYADQFNIELWWKASAQGQPPFGRLRIPMGIGLNGPVWIDFSDNAHGPHGIIAGTTGAGKSELLSSLIIGLAVTHHPRLVNFVLVDFKGGAAFKPFEKMPHTVGMVSDLSGNLTERALHALKSELRRREHILSEANVKKIAQYQTLHAQKPTAFPPLPNLFIIIDEFAELAKEHPTFMDGLVSVVQKGRSLGVHLILATQKPTGSVNPNIWSNLKFRICLRVASVQDSRDMLGRSEAGLLPFGIPGRAYFQVGAEIFELFQSARISQAARVADESLLSEGQNQPGAEEVTDQRVLVRAMERYTEEMQRELFRPWPDPLPHSISLQEIMRRPDVQPASISMQTDAQAGPRYGWLVTPVGLVDLPVEQRQEALMLDLARQGGHLLVAGASGSGKSVFLRTLVLSLAQTHTPSQLHMYLIDYGGQALRVFEHLPHVGGVFGESHTEYIRRLLRKLSGIIEERKEICRVQQIDDFLAYQRRRLEKPSLPEMPAILLVIDKFIEFKQAHDKEMDILLAIARFGRSYGVYLVLSADRPIAVPTQLLSLLDTRFGLRLVELTDSLILLGKHDAAHLDPALPGRAYRRGKTLDEVHFALPTAGEDDDEQTRLLDEAVTQLARESDGRFVPPIQLLPEYVRVDDFLVEAAFSNYASSTSVMRVRLGIEDISLQPVALELSADTPHALVAGGPGSGRTGVLQTFLLLLASTPVYTTARVILVDFRRTSRSLRRLPSMWAYADTEERLTSAVEALKTELRERMTSLRVALEEEDNGQDDAVSQLNLSPIVLVIDDYDQLTALTKNPLNDLKEFWLQARDLRLHILVAGSPADLGRSDPMLTQIRAGRLGIVLGGDPTDPPVLGVRMADMPPGRGYLVRRNARYLVQFAHVSPEFLAGNGKHLLQPAPVSLPTGEQQSDLGNQVAPESSRQAQQRPAALTPTRLVPLEQVPDEPSPDEVRTLAGLKG
jgi:S-DNA-T family DNA segregation ATPase FtsK/SpoIIIE